jgi:two-component system response regulator PilR (NtrC family)
MVLAGLFRQDLYYRINVIDLHVPPLRERSSDIPALIDHILDKLTNDGNITQPTISKDALAALQHYHFPGNVRELENILERALALYDGKCIEIDDLNLPVSLKNGADSPEYDPAMGSLEDYLEAIERKAITLALEENKWNKTAAAKQLGLSFRSFRYRLKKLDLDN